MACSSGSDGLKTLSNVVTLFQSLDIKLEKHKGFM